jgi:hypothetical protein
LESLTPAITNIDGIVPRSKKKQAVRVKAVNPKAKPKVHVYFGRSTERLHVDVRLTAAEERGLYEALQKRYGRK